MGQACLHVVNPDAPTRPQFPELLDWPGTVRSMGWTVLLDGQKVPATLVSDPRRDLWGTLFGATTFGTR